MSTPPQTPPPTALPSTPSTPPSAPSNPYLTSFYKGKEEYLQRASQKAELMKQQGLDKLEDFSYMGQKKYFEMQLNVAKRMAFLYTLATFGVGGAVGFGVRKFLRVPKTMAFGAGFLSTAYLWITFSWSRIEVWSHYRGKLEELEDWKEKRPNKVTSKNVPTMMKEAPIFPTGEFDSNQEPRRLSPALPGSKIEEKSKPEGLQARFQKLKENLSDRLPGSDKR